MRLWSLIAGAAALVGASGCAEVPASNPFDPATPAAQQQPGRIAGRLAVPDGYQASLVFDQAQASLFGALDRNEALASVGIGEDGGFLFEELQPGAYRLRVDLSGFEPIDEAVTCRWAPPPIWARCSWSPCSPDPLRTAG